MSESKKDKFVDGVVRGAGVQMGAIAAIATVVFGARGVKKARSYLRGRKARRRLRR